MNVVVCGQLIPGTSLRCTSGKGHEGECVCIPYAAQNKIKVSAGPLTERVVLALEAIADAQTILAQRALTGSSVDEGTAGARVRERFSKK